MSFKLFTKISDSTQWFSCLSWNLVFNKIYVPWLLWFPCMKKNNKSLRSWHNIMWNCSKLVRSFSFQRAIWNNAGGCVYCQSRQRLSLSAFKSLVEVWQHTSFRNYHTFPLKWLEWVWIRDSLTNTFNMTGSLSMCGFVDLGYLLKKSSSRGAFKDNITNEYVSVYMIPSWSQLDVTPQKCPLIYKIAHPLWDYGCFIEVTAYTGWGCICYSWIK